MPPGDAKEVEEEGLGTETIVRKNTKI